jgi:DNA methylase
MKHAKQLPLFDLNPQASVEDKIAYNGIPASRSTFKAGLSALVHRWFRLTPSFGPDLVREMLETLECDSNDVVLDPFAGAGTTMIECQLKGIVSYGIEINPFLHFAASTCLNWEITPEDIRATLTKIHERFHQLDTTNDGDDRELNIPHIHNPTRWWRPDILAQLLRLKQTIDELSPTLAISAFLRLGLAAVLVPELTNVTLSRLQLFFIDRSSDDIQVWETFYNHILDMVSDLDNLRELGLKQTSKIILADSTQISDIRFAHPINCVITSPPYPNRYSYVWNTRPHLYFFDFFNNAQQASLLDKATIGGTWGTATSILAKGNVLPAYPIINDVVVPIITKIRESDPLMANYAMKYFNALASQIVSMESLLAEDARIAYVVGCSRLKGVYIETDTLLGKIIEGLNLGYRVDKIERIRKRNSGKDLHESIVYARKN